MGAEREQAAGDASVRGVVVNAHVLDGEREVLGDSWRPWRWRLPMPPGDYLVEIERRTGKRRQRLQVGRQDLELTLRA